MPSINDFVVKAAALALREHPVLNATIVDDEIRELADIHVGLAVAVPGGLFVPVVRHADELSLTEIAEETRALAGAAREGRSASTSSRAAPSRSPPWAPTASSSSPR